MNAQETVILCRMIKSLCPSQIIDQYTPDAWARVLTDIPFEDAQEAVATIYREQGCDAEWVRRIEADDIIRQVKRVREHRWAKVTDAVPPPGLSQAEERDWFRELYRRAADGEPVDISNTRGELVARSTKEVLAICAPTRVIDDVGPVDKADHKINLQPGPGGPICATCDQPAVRIKAGKWRHAEKVDA